jgi:hypothetical protein
MRYYVSACQVVIENLYDMNTVVNRNLPRTHKTLSVAKTVSGSQNAIMSWNQQLGLVWGRGPERVQVR